MNKKEFFELIKSIFDKGNTVTFAINNPNHEGIIVNEWSVEEDCGTELPDSLLTSQAVQIDIETAWDVVSEFGMVYPVIYDETLQKQVL